MPPKPKSPAPSGHPAGAVGSRRCPGYTVISVFTPWPCSHGEARPDAPEVADGVFGPLIGSTSLSRSGTS